MKAFEARLVLRGTYRIEDPHCPSGWHNSGCFDIDVPFRQLADALVFAESEEQAREKINEYDFSDHPDYTVTEFDDVTILKIKESEETPEYYDGDVVVNYYEPETND